MAKARPDRHRVATAKVSMGLQQDMMVRLDRRLRDELEALHQQLYGELPKSPLSKFMGYCMALGMDQLKARKRR